MRSAQTIAILLTSFVLTNGVSAGSALREVVSLDFGWRFYRNDPVGVAWRDGLTDSAPSVTSPVHPGFDDSGWRRVDVPHDYVVEGCFDPAADVLHASLPVPPAWYRKWFVIPSAAQGRRLWLEFDGVYRDSRMWLNGHYLGNHASGYTSFRHDITAVAKPGAENVLTVRVDPSAFEGWWYEGGGIYRHVRLVSASPLHVAPWGVQVIATAPAVGKDLRADANLAITTTVENEGPGSVEPELVHELLDAKGAVVARISEELTIGATTNRVSTQEVGLPRAKLWSCQDPNLYRVRTSLRLDGKAIDQVTMTFGVRTVGFEADRGLLLNGKPVKIKGACIHQDFAGVGVAVAEAVHEFRVRRLKEMGANAIRCSHHPMAPELLDLCDRLGIMVMDENRFLGDSREILVQVESMVLRDRNHPSVVLWSLCNEEKEQGSEIGAKQAKAMVATIRRLDPTRPITAAMNGGFGMGLSQVIDVQGFNYHSQDYDWVHQKFPEKPLIATETAAAVGTRGMYDRDRILLGNESYEGLAGSGHLAAYDVNAPGWGLKAEHAWRAVAERPWMAGGFVWTGFDYRGEPTPFGWPNISSQFGILDICGFPKDIFHYYRSWWSSEPVLHVFPHWNWAGKEGQEIDVWVYSNCERVELFLNGVSQGEQRMQPNGHLEWKVRYAPGKLVARGVRQGRRLADAVETTGPPAAVVLEASRRTIAADGADATLVTARIVDRQGRTVPTAANEVSFKVTGEGRLLGVGNGDPGCREPDKATRRSSFNGLCLAVVQASRVAGTILVEAEAADLRPARTAVKTKPTRIAVERGSRSTLHSALLTLHGLAVRESVNSQ